jgi:hypothetical protein
MLMLVDPVLYGEMVREVELKLQVKPLGHELTDKLKVEEPQYILSLLVTLTV